MSDTTTAPSSTKVKKPVAKYRYRLLIGKHVEADYDAEPDHRLGLYPDKYFHGPCDVVSVSADLHQKYPGKFAVPLAWSGEDNQPIPEGSFVYDPATETIEQFSARVAKAATQRQANTGGSTASPVAPQGQPQAVTLPPHARTLPDFDRMSLKELVAFAEEEEITLTGNGNNITEVRKAIKTAVAAKGTR